MIDIKNAECVSMMKRIPASSINLIIADPPYNIGIDYGVCKDNLTEEGYIGWCTSWIFQCDRILKNNGTMYIINYPEKAALLLKAADRRRGCSSAIHGTLLYTIPKGKKERRFRGLPSYLFWKE